MIGSGLKNIFNTGFSHRREVLGVDAGLDHVRRSFQRIRVESVERVSIGIGDTQDEIESFEGLALEAQHPLPLLAKEETGHWIRRVLCVAPPDFRFDVVREEDGGAGQRLRHVDDRRKKIGHHRVEAARPDEPPNLGSISGSAVLGHRVRDRFEQIP